MLFEVERPLLETAEDLLGHLEAGQSDQKRWGGVWCGVAHLVAGLARVDHVDERLHELGRGDGVLEGQPALAERGVDQLERQQLHPGVAAAHALFQNLGCLLGSGVSPPPTHRSSLELIASQHLWFMPPSGPDRSSFVALSM